MFIVSEPTHKHVAARHDTLHDQERRARRRALRRRAGRRASGAQVYTRRWRAFLNGMFRCAEPNIRYQRVCLPPSNCNSSDRNLKTLPSHGEQFHSICLALRKRHSCHVNRWSNLHPRRLFWFVVCDVTWQQVHLFSLIKININKWIHCLGDVDLS